MEPLQRAYYASLREGYADKIRALVPAYDDMARWILDLVGRPAPAWVLDIGPGTGELDRALLEEVPGAHLTAVEASAEMLEHCQAALIGEPDRARVVHANILEFQPDRAYDVVFTNLVLHNLEPRARQGLVARIRAWLAPNGRFVWGDLIRYRDEEVQRALVRYREEFARSRGCPEALLRENFEKEGRHDFPLTVEETFQLAAGAGFVSREVVWMHDTFAVFLLRAPEEEGIPPAAARSATGGGGTPPGNPHGEPGDV